MDYNNKHKYTKEIKVEQFWLNSWASLFLSSLSRGTQVGNHQIGDAFYVLNAY